MKNDLKKEIYNFIKKERFAVIATQNKKEPYTNLVTFIFDDNLKKIFFPTSKNTQKFQNLKTNSKISILIDNRNNKKKDFKKIKVITGIGSTKEINDNDLKNKFIKKHPYLIDFLKSPDCVMIEISIKKFIFVDNFENINILNLN